MQKRDLANVIVRAILDEEFRKELTTNPKKTLRIAGVKLPQREFSALTKLKLKDWNEMKLKDVVGSLRGIEPVADYKTTENIVEV